MSDSDTAGGGHLIKDDDNSYRVSDPFFVVKCFDCGKAVWNTHRVNSYCCKCGGENVKTFTPTEWNDADRQHDSN